MIILLEAQTSCMESTILPMPQKKFVDETKTTYDVCADSTMPSFIVKKGIIRKFLDFKNNRNGHIRYITDVTGESIGYCKQVVEAAQVSQKEIFRVNETECHYNVVLAKREDNNIGENVRKPKRQKMYKA